MLRHKYKAVRTECDGHKFASKAEAKYYGQLKLLRDAGKVVQFLMQVPFHLPGGVKYVADFLVFWEDGTVQFIDVKGMETAAFKAKRRIVEELYAPIQITTVKVK